MTTQIAERPVLRKLNESMIEALSLTIAKGNYASTACQLCGIEWHSLQRWMKQALKDMDSNIEESIYIQLYTSVKKAEAEAEAKLVEVVRNSAVVDKNWIAGMTMLERRHPDRWGRKDRTQVDITEKKVLQITHEVIMVTELPEFIEGEYKELPSGQNEEIPEA